MSITEELEQIREDLAQLNAAVDVRARIRKIHRNILDLDNKVTFYQANAGFDEIPPDTKAALIRFYQRCMQLKDANAADADFAAIIGATRPPVA